MIRVEPTGSRNVTWAEFVEAGLLRSYRREHDVPLKELRDFIDRLRDEFQVPYPLADRRPYVGPGRRLLIDLQGRSHLDPEFCLVAVANGQIVLTAPGEEFYERVDWSGDEPAGWRPHEDPASPVRINPLVRFGMPAIGGISTEAIAGELDGGASLEEAADDFGLDIDAVRWAQSYELSQRAVGMNLRAAQVRIYLDADMLGLGKILAGLRNDVTYPGDPGAVIHKRQRAPCPITSPDVLDTDWIPQVAARGWLIITRDSMIIQNRNEIAAVRENKAKMVALNQRDAQTKWGQLEVFMTQWRRIEALISEPGPFIWRVSRTAITPIALD